jgi:Ni,Fe-hydrogenase III large subunit/Ni,Fe-hydrogenase III component G
MPLRAWVTRSEEQAGAPGLRALTVSSEEWRQVAYDVAATGGWMITLWASTPEEGNPNRRVHAVYQADRTGLVATLQLEDANARYPALDEIFPAAARLQRAVADLSGVRSTAADSRPWLRHAAWPSDYYPLAESTDAASNFDTRPGHDAGLDHYEFIRVEGDGVHEIPVGPVHAGIIEPGHFRFSVVGEKVLRLEERLGYVHKGIERRFTQLPALEGHRLAARISGDSAVAFSWAYCQALEALCACTASRRAALLRALCLEIERIQNHLGDLGALGNDAGFAFGLAQFSRLKEEWLRTVAVAFDQRYLFDVIVPGGLAKDLTPQAGAMVAEHATRLATEVRELRDLYDSHPGVRDRFVGAGEVKPELARRLGLVGLAGRASGVDFDARVDLPAPPYDVLVPSKVVLQQGDVAARVAVRFEELIESCQLIALIIERLPREAHRIEVGMPAAGQLAVGLIEGWRGPVLIALEAGPGGTLRRCHPHDPSWQNWPVLEHAIIGNIVPDFPLINKSFNLSYSGHDG